MSAELCAVKKLFVLSVSTAGASSEAVIQNLVCVGASSWSHRVSLPSCASMSSFSGAGRDAAPSPGRSPQSLELPCSDPLPGHLPVVLSPQHGFWHKAAQDCGDEPVLGHVSACASAVSVAVTIPKALRQ